MTYTEWDAALPKIVVHPAASIFPMMSDDELRELAEDIRQNGQNESIVFWNDQLIDGRNRLKACEQLGIEPQTCELMEETDPFAYVVSANIHRRHLEVGQRALIAARMAKLTRGGDRKSEDIKGQDCTLIEDAAALLNVSPRSVKSAKHVLANGSKELVNALELKQVTLNQAEKLCQVCDDKREQTRLVKEGKKAIREFLNPTPEDDYSQAELMELVGKLRTAVHRLSNEFRQRDRLDALVNVLRSEASSFEAETETKQPAL